MPFHIALDETNLLDALVFAELIEGNHLDPVHDTVDGLADCHDASFVVIQATVFPSRNLNTALAVASDEANLETFALEKILHVELITIRLFCCFHGSRIILSYPKPCQNTASLKP